MNLFLSTLIFINFSLITNTPSSSTDEELMQKAKELSQKILIIDTHIDVPYRLEEKYEDISERTAGGDFDFVRAKTGGLDVPFISIYVPAEEESKKNAKNVANGLIVMVEGFATKWPDKFQIVSSTKDVLNNAFNGKVLLAMGIENGAPIEGDLKNLRHFYNRGIRYITLCHSKSNHISDSSYDEVRKWNGLSPFGKELVSEMNKTGMMIDVSHISDLAFYDVMEITEVPVIASHSSCRHFTPGWERNMDDDMIKKLGENGGVIQINFGSSFLDGDIKSNREKSWSKVKKFAAENKISTSDPRAAEFRKQYMIENPHFADISDVVKHINHAVKLAGIDHVGLGSDFDGVGDSLPEGLKDVSYYPNLIFQLLKAGYSELDIEKICGGNLMRVWKANEEYAAKQ
ncbi:MAG: dipeptidase [Melioribacteraceae bacterium]|nr:dipeptidase [Melioribacteraceae bacterium]